MQSQLITGLAFILGSSLAQASPVSLVSGFYQSPSGCDVSIQNDQSGSLKIELLDSKNHSALKNQASLELDLTSQKATKFFACSQNNQASLHFQTEVLDFSTQYTVMCNSDESDSKMLILVNTESNQLISVSLVETQYLDWVQVRGMNSNCDQLRLISRF